MGSSGPKKNLRHLHILWVYALIGFQLYQELQVSRKENEMENSCSDIGEVHRVNVLQGKLARISYIIYEITLNFRCFF